MPGKFWPCVRALIWEKVQQLYQENLEDLARALNRRPDAISMKLKRMGLQVPPRKREKSLAKISEKKNSFFYHAEYMMYVVKSC